MEMDIKLFNRIRNSIVLSYTDSKEILSKKKDFKDNIQ